MKIRRIMEVVPKTEQEIETIKANVYDNPLFIEKIISKKGDAAALYIPIQQKDMSYRISKEIESLLQKEFGKDQKYYVAGLPAAEDTFGVEMFVQMGILAPLIGFVLFILMFILFRKFSLIVSPMVVAMFSVAWGMGALIGLGFTVHIMSSMIPIFLMPIAVLDSVHILSEFYDRYPALRDRKQTLLAVTDELFTPMFYTSITTAVGFSSLALADIPPVRVFGVFVAFGVMAAWLLTITLIPASIMLIREEKLAAKLAKRETKSSPLAKFLPAVGRFAFARSRTVVLASVLILVVGIWGLTKIVVNDNPVNWFNKEHKIRIADRVMNQRFGGTYMAYLSVAGRQPNDIKKPEVMAYISKLQKYLEEIEVVGKTSSVADIVKRVGHILKGDPESQAKIPKSQDEIAQYLFLFLMSGDPNDLDNFVDYDYQHANIWVQMKRGNNLDMERVEGAVQQFISSSGSPEGIQIRWSGLTYINKVWQDLPSYSF
jgi:predicted RND superfamily exporter protein